MVEPVSNYCNCLLENVNLLKLTKHATEKDRSLKTHMILGNMDSCSSENEILGKKIGRKAAFLKT